jgi:hypothetical protein
MAAGGQIRKLAASKSGLKETSATTTNNDTLRTVMFSTFDDAGAQLRKTRSC